MSISTNGSAAQRIIYEKFVVINGNSCLKNQSMTLRARRGSSGFLPPMPNTSMS